VMRSGLSNARRVRELAKVADSGHAEHEQAPVLERESPEQEFDIVDETSIESFPASDPAAWISQDTRRATGTTA
jgi:hypothetical protein